MKVALFFEFTEVCIQLPCRGYVSTPSEIQSSSQSTTSKGVECTKPTPLLALEWIVSVENWVPEINGTTLAKQRK